jgi:hypothetical protein
MKKELLLYTFISFLFFGNITTYSQENTENQTDIEVLENTDSDNIENNKKDIKTNKKEKSKREELEKKLDYLTKLKYSTTTNNLDGLKEIEEQIKDVKKEISGLFNDPEFLGTPIYNAEDFWKLITKAIFNLLIILIIARYIYYPVTRNKDYLFTFLLISLTVFLLCVLLDSVKLQLGFALGLFAIFGIIRYRTDPIPIKEMTYLFLVIGISVVNALANKKISHAELVFANLMIVFATFGMERIWLLKHETRKNVTYEKIELIVPERREELLADLKARTGLNVVRIEVRRIDFLRDTANLRIFYYEDDSQ